MIYKTSCGGLSFKTHSFSVTGVVEEENRIILKICMKEVETNDWMCGSAIIEKKDLCFVDEDGVSIYPAFPKSEENK